MVRHGPAKPVYYDNLLAVLVERLSVPVAAIASASAFASGDLAPLARQSFQPQKIKYAVQAQSRDTHFAYD